ncbi:hypothetical protein JCM11641_004254 [Rhodosporidiobolus odoratus]
MSVWLLTRTILYAIAIASSFFAFILAAAFVGKTEADFDGYYEASVELLVTSILALVILPVLHFFFHRRGSPSVAGSLMVELAVVFVLWALFLGGGAAMASDLPGLNSNWCDAQICGIGRALEAFTWITWVALTILFGLLLAFGILGQSRGEAGVWRNPFNPGSTSLAAGGTKSAGTTGVNTPKPVEMGTTV